MIQLKSVEMSMNNSQSHPYGGTGKSDAKQGEKVDTFWFAQNERDFLFYRLMVTWVLFI